MKKVLLDKGQAEYGLRSAENAISTRPRQAALSYEEIAISHRSIL
jgi:hypothetical protein